MYMHVTITVIYVIACVHSPSAVVQSYQCIGTVLTDRVLLELEQFIQRGYESDPQNEQLSDVVALVEFAHQRQGWHWVFGVLVVPGVIVIIHHHASTGCVLLFRGCRVDYVVEFYRWTIRYEWGCGPARSVWVVNM